MDADSVSIKTPDGVKKVPADTVIMSVGYTPDKRFVPQAKENGRKPFAKKKIYFVGDCDRVGSLKTVIKQAYELVQKISY